MSDRLTPAQRSAAEVLFEVGWHGWVGSFHGQPQRNRPLWKLVSLGLAEMEFGPRGSWLQSYCFMPIWTDPVC